MLYIKDNIVKDSSLIVLDNNGRKIYNPKHSDLVSAGWTKVSNESSTEEFFIKKTIYTTSEEFEQLDKTTYKDCLLFIQDTEQIWLNGKFYGASSSSELLEWEILL